MSHLREQIASQYTPLGEIPRTKKADFAGPNNPISLEPIPETTPSDTKSRNSGGTANFLPNERKRASFKVSDMITAIDGSEKTTARRKFIQSPVEDKDGMDKYFLTRPELFRESLRNWVEIHDPFLKSFKPTGQDMRFMQKARVIGGGPAANFGLFTHPIISRGSQEQIDEFVVRARALKIVGCYCQTELGHGSNVRGLETTATYDKTTEEFVLDTPNLTSIKWWITGMGKYATHAILFAQLVIDGKEYGIHEFIVQLRDENHRPLPGITIGDVGPKLGGRTGDTGFLRLDKIRIPRDRMLNKLQQVLPDGSYVKSQRKKNPYTHYFTMLITRAGIVRGAATSLSRAATISIRYSAVRHQGFVDATQGISHKSQERPVLDYQIQQYRLFKQLSQAYAFICSSRWLGKAFDRIGDIGENVELVKEIAATTAGLKSMITLMTLEGIEDCRKSCGGHGYLRAAGVSQLMVDYLPSPTFEGDWVILYMQTARFLVKSLREMKGGSKTTSEGGLLDYLTDDFIAKVPALESTTVEDYLNADFLLQQLKLRARRAVLSAANSFEESIRQGKQWSDAWNENAMLLVHAAREHSLQFLMYLFIDEVKHVEQPDCRRVLEHVVLMFGLSQLTDFSTGHLLSHDAGSTKAAQAITRVLALIRPEAVSLVDSFDFTDSALASALGRSDGNVYESLWESTQRSDLNQMDPFLGYELLSPYLDKEFLKKGNSPLSAKSKL